MIPWLVLLLNGGALPAPPPEQPPVLAMVAPARGEVRLDAVKLDPDLYVYAREGQQLELTAEARARILCPSSSCFVLSESTTIDPVLCERKNRELCPVAQSFAPRKPARHIGTNGLVTPGSFDLDGSPRGEDGYILVSPRCPKDSIGTPPCTDWLTEPGEILFVPVTGAEEYRFELELPERRESLVVKADGLFCPPSSLELCRVPWPTGWKLPAGGKVAYLGVKVLADAGKEIRDQETALRLRMGELPASLGLRGVHRDTIDLLPLSLALLDYGLPSEVVVLLSDRKDLQPELDLVLAKAYLETGSAEIGLVLFNQAGQKSGSNPLIRAEARLGAARCEMDLERSKEEPKRLLEEALAIYQDLGMTERVELIRRLLVHVGSSPKQ